MEIRGFVGPQNRVLSPIADQESTMNMYLEKAQSPGNISEEVLYSIPGFELLAESPYGGVGRAHFSSNGREFAVIGDRLLEIDVNGVLTLRGSVALDGNPATICGNGDAGNQLLVTSGGNAYVYDLAANTLTAIAALAGIAFMAVSLDGYGLVLDRSSSTVYVSDLNDFSTFNLSNFIQRSQAPDPWISMGVNNKYVHFIGEKTGEAWYNAGTFPIAFQPASAGLYNYGTSSSFSPHVVDDALAWLGATENGSGVIVRAPGLRPQVISNDAIQYSLGTYASLSDAIGDCHEIGGHTIYTITFPSANATWAWDSAGPNWTGRGTWDSTQGNYVAWRPIFHSLAFNESRFLDLKGSGVYRMKTELATELDPLNDGSIGIRWARSSPAIVNGNRQQFFGAFELICETGIGTVSGQGENPQVMMDMSEDGGRTFGPEQWRSMGRMGEYGTRVRWTRCGKGRKKVFRVAGSDPVRVMIAGATVEYEPSTER